MVHTNEQKKRRNAKRRAERAASRAHRTTTPRDGARELLVSKLVASAVRRVVQLAKARHRTNQWIKTNASKKREADAARYEDVKNRARVSGLSYKDFKNMQRCINSVKDRYNASRRHKERKLVDEEFLVSSRLRTRLGEFMKLKNGTKAAGTMQLVGCSKAFLVNHLKSQIPEDALLKDFTVDHIFPMASYDMTCPEEQKRCMNYTNLQPLKGSGINGNSSKGASLPSLRDASRVARDCWPCSISECDLH